MINEQSPLKIVLLASGSGSNARRIIEMSLRHAHRLQVVGIISDRFDCPLLSESFPSEVSKIFIPFPTKSEELPTLEKRRMAFDQRLKESLQSLNADWAILAGFMRLFGPGALQLFWDPRLMRHRVINLHPSLLPEFPGMDAMDRSFRAGHSTGPTIHYVDEKLDHGPLILQLPVPALARAGQDHFMKRMKRSEHLGLCKVVLELAYLGKPKGENREMAAF